MNFSKISSETLLGRLIRFPLRIIPGEMVMPILQGRMKGKKWITGAGNHGYWLGSYEYQKRKIIEKTIVEGKIFFDIGAHTGFYTILGSELVGPSGMVVAFEPMPRNLYYLRKHLQLNAITNVKIFEAAVTDRCGTSHFVEGENSSEGHISSSGAIMVKTVSLDKLIERCRIPIPDFIKIDVEGAEMLVLSGGKSMLSKIKPIVFLSTHGAQQHYQCCNFLKSLDYDLRSIGSEVVEMSEEIVAY